MGKKKYSPEEVRASQQWFWNLVKEIGLKDLVLTNRRDIKSL